MNLLGGRFKKLVGMVIAITTGAWVLLKGRLFTRGADSAAEESTADTRTVRLRPLPGARSAATWLARSTDRTIEEGRSRLLSSVPMTAESKWRISLELLHGMMSASANGTAAADGVASLLHQSGLAHATGRRPPSGWTPIYVMDIMRAVGESLGLDADYERTRGTVTLTIHDALRDGADGDMVRSLLFSQERSLFAGLAEGTGTSLQVDAGAHTGEVEQPLCLRFTV